MKALRNPVSWTTELDERLRTAWASGDSVRVIAMQLGVTWNAVTSRVYRLKLPRRPSPIGNRKYVIADTTRQARDDLAEQMAQGCPSVSEAARRLRLTQSMADQHWQAIKRGLGVEQCQ